MKKIDEKTVIPLVWVLAAYIPTTTLVITIAIWVNSVNFRLDRIEKKMGVTAEVPALFSRAEAKE